MHADPVDKANILHHQIREDEGDILCLDGQPYPSMSDIKVTKGGLEKLLTKINPSKACGPDMIPARILRDMVREISPILTTLFQRTLDLENSQKTGNQIIFKKGDRFNASKYRTVSLTSFCCKLQEHVITSHI